MTSKNRKIVLGTSLLVAACGIGFLIYKRQVNKRNSGLMLEYIDGLVKENTVGAQNAIANVNVDSAKNVSSLNLDSLSKYKVSLVAFDNKWYNLSNSIQRKTAIDLATNIARELYDSINRVGTDKIKFDRNFRRIGTNGAFILVNSVYKSLYKKDLWKDIEGEEVLYKGAGNGWNAVLGLLQDLPNYDLVISEQARVWNTLEKQLKTK
jgi:hypothetical protein